MKISKDYTILLNEQEYQDLLAILAYQGRLTSYNPGAAQPEVIADKAKHMWHVISEED